jgi:hypothetical protein
MTDWHTQLEKELIREFGGTPRESFGPDGTMPDGRPVEVRVAATDDRFRLNRETHQELLEEDGSYIFDDVNDDLPPQEVHADNVDAHLGDDWYSDRGYMHQFVAVDEIL